MLKKFGILFIILAMLVSVMAVTAIAEEENVIYIKDGGTGDGSSPENAMGIGGITESDKLYKNAPLYRAWEKLKTTGGTIVICGPYTLKESDAQRVLGEADIIMDSWYRNPNATITYTSVYGGVDYRSTAGAKLVFEGKVALTLPTASVFENVNIVAGDTAGRRHYLCASFCPLTLGQGTNFVANSAGELPVIVGGHRNYSGIVGVNDDANIIVDIGNNNTVGDIYGALARSNKDQNGNVNITIKSGKINGVFGDFEHGDASTYIGLNGQISITLTGGIYYGEIAANNVGFASSCTEKKASIRITGGDFSACEGIKATSKYHDRELSTQPGPANMVLDCSGASVETARQVVAVASVSPILPDNYTEAPQPTDPPATDPQPTDPPATDPQPTDPPATDPQPTDPPATDPQPTDPPATDPQPTDPVQDPTQAPTQAPTSDSFVQTEKSFDPTWIIVVAIFVVAGAVCFFIIKKNKKA